MTLPPRGYHVALSFARGSRPLAVAVARELAPEYRIFLDQDEQEELWGAELLCDLPQRYLSAMVCVVLLTDEYMERFWTALERDTIIEEVLHEKGADAVLCIRLPGCSVEPPHALASHMISLDAGLELAGILKVLRPRLERLAPDAAVR